MYAATLPQLVHDHCDQIVSGTLDRVRREPDLSALLEHCDLANWFQRIVVSLDRWPGIVTDGEAEQLHFGFGQDCGRNAIPLHQSMRALHLLKTRIFDFARSRGLVRNSLEIYVEEELENRVSFFFDWLLYNVVLGYESLRPLHLDKPQASKKEDMRDLPGWIPL